LYLLYNFITIVVSIVVLGRPRNLKEYGSFIHTLSITDIIPGFSKDYYT